MNDDEQEMTESERTWVHGNDAWMFFDNNQKKMDGLPQEVQNHLCALMEYFETFGPDNLDDVEGIGTAAGKWADNHGDNAVVLFAKIVEAARLYDSDEVGRATAALRALRGCY